jgi:hypothetical protein
MALRRKQDWEILAFNDFLMERAKAPFAWGGNDCALFAADGIEAITGVDIASDFRGKYSDEAGAFAAIKEICGGATVADAAIYCAGKHGLTEWPMPLMARRGDLVVFDAPSGALVAGLVHLSGRHIVAVGEQGLFRFPISAVKRAWHYE